MVEENLRIVRRNIALAAEKSGRRPEAITLVCVTKEADIANVKEAVASGVADIGENRLQDAIAKYNSLGDAARWHFIGHLQTNKAKKAVEIFDLIHSVDSFRLAEAISKEAAKLNKVQGALIQVNVSAEETKFGIAPQDAADLIRRIAILKNIKVLGLMTIAPLAEDPQKARPYFRKLKQLSEEVKNFLFTAYDLKFVTISMGMSNDYMVAIEDGATIVRIGSAIFR